MRCLALVGLIWLLISPSVQAEGPVVRLVEFESTVNPVTARRITKAIDDAEAAGDTLVLIRLDTPGGMVVSMETILKKILDSEVPVVAWVGPSGAKAASAGFFILIAVDVAAMAPGTRTGAASTVMMGGDNKEGDVLLKKMNEDLAALIRSVAKRRGRDVAASEDAVFAAKAYEEQVALEKGLVDLVTNDIDELLAQLDGYVVTRFDGTEETLHTAGATIVTSEFSWRHEFMEFLALPAVAYVLLMLGILGLYVEFTHPGVVFPGVVGALCLLLFALASTTLPVSTIAVLLILLAIVMFILEIKVTSYGMLTVGGIVSLLIGSLMLIDGPIPELRVPPALVIPMVIALAGACVFVIWLVVRAQKVGVDTGREGLPGTVGVVTVDLAPEGKVFIRGEIWDAVSATGPLTKDTKVKVVRADELKLLVEPADHESFGEERS
jgi:membrane-bound serine protease (ClpP class)